MRGLVGFVVCGRQGDDEGEISIYILRSDIIHFVSISSCRMMDDMVVRARERGIDLEMDKKRKLDLVQSLEGSGKRPKVFDSRSRGQQGWGCYGKYGKMHSGACRVGGFGCFKCGRMGHISRDCTTIATTTLITDLVFFHCSQRGHKNANFLSLATSTLVVAPALVTLRITNDLLGKAEAYVVRSRAFHMTTEEACAAPNVVEGMYLLIIPLFVMIFLLISMFCLLGRSL